jgi:hypothetical protein
MFVSIVKTKAGFNFEMTSETLAEAIEMSNIISQDNEVVCSEIFEKELKFDEPKLIASLRTIK